MANWSNPILTSTYTNFVTEVKDRDVDVAVWFEGMSPTNLPTNAKRLNTTNGRFEKWNGTSWVDAIATFTFPALSVAGNATVTGTLGVTSTTTLTGALTINGGIANNPTLTSGTANGVLYLNGSKVATSGSALTFDGTNLTLATAGGLARFARVADGGIAGIVGSRSGTDVSLYNGGGVTSEFVAGANELRFNVSASEQMRLTSTGLGIGTSSPGSKLQVTAPGKATIFGSTTAQNSYSAWQYNSTDVGYIGNGGGVIGAAGGADFGITAFTGGKLWLGANNGTGTTYAVLDSSGNLGLGVTPSAWGSILKPIQLGNAFSYVAGRTDGVRQVWLGSNSYYNGTNWIYGLSSPAAQYYQNDGIHIWNTAPSGTAGNAITFTQAMTLDASGNLIVGAASAGNAKVSSVSSIAFEARDSSQPFYQWYNSSGALNKKYWRVGNNTSGDLQFQTVNDAYNSASNIFVLDNAGGVGVGEGSPSTYGKFVVRGNGFVALAIIGDSTNETQLRFLTNTAGRISQQANQPLIFDTNAAERLRLTSAGDLEANASVTGYWRLPNGTTAQRPAGAAGQIRFNTTLSKYEGHNGSGWSSIGGGATGGGTDDIFYENGQTVTTNYTITTNKNAMSAGPVTIASGITVTVPSGSNWAVL